MCGEKVGAFFSETMPSSILQWHLILRNKVTSHEMQVVSCNMSCSSPSQFLVNKQPDLKETSSLPPGACRKTARAVEAFTCALSFLYVNPSPKKQKNQRRVSSTSKVSFHLHKLEMQGSDQSNVQMSAERICNAVPQYHTFANVRVDHTAGNQQRTGLAWQPSFPPDDGIQSNWQMQSCVGIDAEMDASPKPLHKDGKSTCDGKRFVNHADAWIR